MAQRRHVVTRVSDETGASLVGATAYILRSGSVNIGLQTIVANSSATVNLRHPGGLKLNDEVYVVRAGVLLDTSTVKFRLTTSPAYSAFGYWTVDLLDIAGVSNALLADDRLVLAYDDSGHRVDYYKDDTTTTAVTPKGTYALPATTGQLDLYVEHPDVDIAVVQSDGTATYFIDLPAEDRIFVRPEEFGAVGDGVADDTNALLAAFNYVKNGNGGTILFSEGTYIWNGTLLPIGDNTKIVGYGATLKLSAASSYNANVYCMGTRTATSYDAGISYTENVTIEGIKIDGNIGSVTTTASSLGIVAHQVRDWVVRDVEIVDMPGTTGGGYGISFWYSSRVTVDSCHVDRTDRQNILVWETQQANITNCKLKDSYYRGCILVSTNSPATLQSSHADIVGCDLENTLTGSTGNNRGIRFSGESSGTITGGTIKAVDEGIYIVGTDAKGRYSFSGVEIEQCSDGIGVASNVSSGRYIMVDGCYFNTNTRGIYASGTGGAFVLRGSTFKGNTSNAARIEFVDYVVCEGNVFDGGTNVQFAPTNYARVCDNIVLNMTSATGAMAFNGSGASYWAEGNVLQDNTSDKIDINSTSTTGTLILTGSGTPASNVKAPPGSIYLRDDAVAGAAVYVKESGNSNTSSGWAAICSASGFTMTGDINMGGANLDTGGGQLVSSDGTTTWVEFENHTADLTVPLTSAAKPASGAPDLVAINSTTVNAYGFDATTSEELFFTAELPYSWVAGTDITPKLHWMPTNTSTNSVKWAIDIHWINEGAAASTVTTYSVTDAGNGTAWENQEVAFSAINGSGKTEGAILIGRFYRDAGDAADTYSADAIALVLDFEITVNRIGK